MHLVEETRRRDQENQNKFMQDIASRVGGGAPRDNGVRGVSLSTFQDTRPLPFATAVHPMEAEDWLKDTERKLRAVGCTEEEKVRYAVHLLAGPAASWWENTVAIYPLEKVFTARSYSPPDSAPGQGLCGHRHRVVQKECYWRVSKMCLARRGT